MWFIETKWESVEKIKVRQEKEKIYSYMDVKKKIECLRRKNVMEN